MSSWSNLLQRAEPGHHVVHLYGLDAGLLVRNVAEYVTMGLRQNDSVLLVATQGHTDAVLGQVERDTPVGPRLGAQVRVIDAETLLERLVGESGPDWDTFREIVGGTVSDMQAERPRANLRVFGEMVALLWASGRLSEAERLETCWNRLQSTERFCLFCAYPVDPFDAELEPAALGGLFASHSHTCAGNGTLFSTRRQRQNALTGL